MAAWCGLYPSLIRRHLADTYNNLNMKKLIVAGWLLTLSLVVAALFWYNEYQYSLPTPVPPNYTAIDMGTPIKLDGRFNFPNNKPVFIHFFNPDCPCSRFNIKHFKSLVKQYGGKVNFVMVLMTDKRYSPQEIQHRFDIDIPVLPRTNIARLCGVYSTPQAVIISSKHQLFYRGNYNRSRYCNDTKSEYARIALQDLLARQSLSGIDLLAFKAYGCQLPICSR
jgi:hypothetical protein